MASAPWPLVASPVAPQGASDPAAVGHGTNLARPAMHKVNSETNFAVQLLAALRAAPAATVRSPAFGLQTTRHNGAAKQTQRPKASHSSPPPTCIRGDPDCKEFCLEEKSCVAGSEVSTDDNVEDDGTDSCGSRVFRPSCGDASNTGDILEFRDGSLGQKMMDRRSISPGSDDLISIPVSVPEFSLLDGEQHAAFPRHAPRLSDSASQDTTLYKYSREERKEALRRFKEKKRLRTFKKTIRYDIRKRLADTRPRYKGRFSKPPPGENYDDGTPGPSANSLEKVGS